MQTAIDYKYLRLIPNHKFNLWDVKRYGTSSNLQFENVVRLSDILTPFKKSVTKKEMIENEWQIISKINFGGELFLRDLEEINTYKGNLNLVPENAIIYSKINVRHGCIYFNEKGSKPFGVSSEYPTFTFDETKVNGYFLKKVLRSSEFKRLLNTKTSGISKARVKQDEFLNIEIPLPTLTEQEAIVSAYQSKIREAQNLEQQSQDLEEKIERCFLEQLGIEKNNQPSVKKGGLDYINFSELSKWSIDHLNKRSKGFDVSSTRFKTEPIKNLLIFFEGGKTPSKSRKDFWNGDVFWTSPKDFTNKTILDTAIDTISQTAIKEAGVKLFPKGTLLSVFRSGILRHSFPTVITEIETTINQDLKAYSLKEHLIDKFYYLYFVNVFKEYVLLNTSKKSVTVESINTEDFLELPIVLPPLEKQRAIVEKIENLNSKIKNLGKDSDALKHRAEQEFEQAIFS